MRLFGKGSRKRESKHFDRDKFEPAIRSSICTGEKTAGFVSRETGKFTDDRLIRTREDLEVFMEEYGIREEEIKHIY